MSDRQSWRRVNKASPCPICQNDHACKVSADGAVAMCKRIEQGAFKKCRGDWFLHRLKDSANGTAGTGGRRVRSVGRKPAPNKAKARKGENMGQLFSTADAAISDAAKKIGGMFTAAWSYHDAAGREILRVARFDTADGGKDYRPMHPAKNGWKIGDPSGSLPLYRLPDVLKRGDPVWVCEGEKAAEAARSIDLSATTSAHGSDSAAKTDWTPLAGREVVILPDADQAGRNYAHDVAAILMQLDPPARVKIVPLPGLPEAGDIVEYLAERDSMDSDAIRAGTVALAAAVPFLDPASVVGGPVLVCLDDVVAEEVKWLWFGRFALGKINLLSGDPGLGKSFITMDMAARVSTGTPWPDGAECPRGSVIVINGEDDLKDTVKPRLERARANMRNVIAMAGVCSIENDGKRSERSFRLADIPALAAALRQHRDCKLVVIDPVSAYMGGADSHKNTDVRALLAPLAKLAADHQVAIIMVTHLNKNGGSQSAAYRSTGSIAFSAASRSAWAVAKDKENPDRRLLVPVKNNIGNDKGGLAYSIIDGAVAWEKNPVYVTADDALSNGNDGTPGPEPEARDEAANWLRERLANGPVPSKELEDEAGKAGLSWSSTVRRASDEIGVVKEKCRDSAAWQWRLPQPQDDFAQAIPASPDLDNMDNLDNMPFPYGNQHVCGEADSTCPSCSSCSGSGEREEPRR